MAIEIILRDDVSDYEPHPVFGLTYRGVGTLAICGVVGFLLYNALSPFGLDYKVLGMAIMAECAIIGAAGFVKPKGLHMEQYLRAAVQDFLTPAHIAYEPPSVEGATDIALIQLDKTLTRSERKRARREKECDVIYG